MKSFAVVATVSTPIISHGFLTLDAVLAAMIYRKTGDLHAAHNDIPLDRTGVVWHGSQAFFDRYTTGFTGLVRSMKPDDMESGKWEIVSKRKTKYPLYIDQSRDDDPHQWRSRMSLYQTINTGHVYWFGRGDIDQVSDLLSNMQGIGKKASHGFGQVDSLNIEPTDADLSLRLPDGSPARPIPVEMWQEAGGDKSAMSGFYSPEPPYFESPKVLCVVPEIRQLA